MGISIVQKSDLTRPKKNPKVALVLAGGAVTGGAYKVGGLQALDCFLENRRITDFDTFIGLSAGSIIASFLANGFSPAELRKSLDDESDQLDLIRFFDFYHPNFREFVTGPLRFLLDFGSFIPEFLMGIFLSTTLLQEDFRKSVFKLLKHPNLENLEKLIHRYGRVLGLTRDLPSPLQYLPKGLFDNEKIERSVKRNFERNGLPNDFIELRRRTGNELFIVAGNLDSAERVVFGYNQNNNLSISQAVQASTALPGFYKPARIQGVDYVDGGVRKTANIDVAVESGADLIICYNPFRPFHNKVMARYSQEKRKQVVEGRHIADEGMISVLNQVFRILLHTRLTYGMDLYRKDPRFHGDIILIEPTEYDYQFFDMNPLAFWERQRAAQRGFESVKESIERKYYLLKPIFSAYGIELKKPSEESEVEHEEEQYYEKVLYFPEGMEKKILQAAS